MTWVLAVLVLPLAVLWVGQRRLIYLPDRTSPSPLPGVEAVRLSPDPGLDLDAWLLPGSDRLVIVFPGNAGHRGYRMALGQALQTQGWSVLLVDYRGYGGNPGHPHESGLLADARAARRWADQAGYRTIVYLGESLGCGPAAALAAEAVPHGLVLRSPFPSLAEVGKVHYPWIPSFLLRDRFPVTDLLRGREIPMLVVAGTADTIIPLALSQAVARDLGVELLKVEDADHNDPDLAYGPVLIAAVNEVLESSR
ncbi:MAG TPA: alpha/beta hydrolase [Acidimicrobiia bacterium]|nr:alpha/beta hydrolase [Acidimicrobiia bacterium]